MNTLNKSLYPLLPIPLQNAACSFSGFLRYRARFTPHFHRTLREWSGEEHASLEALHEVQRKRLDELVGMAREHVPHYRDLPPPSKKADAIEAIHETLASIPLLSKSEYRDQPEAFLSRAIPRKRLYHSQTSGTTGTALPLWHTSETLAEEYATVWRMRRQAGAELDDPSMTFGGQMIVPVAQAQPPYWRHNAYGRQTLFSLYHMTPANLRDYVAAIHASPARYVQGYPSSIHLVARALLDEGRPLPPGRLVAVFTSSESLLAFQRETIEQAFAAPVFDRYGVSEFAVSMTECPDQRLHLDMEFGIAEIDVTEQDEDSESGPLLVTGLAQNAAPLIRYQIGDVGKRARRPCPCGRAGDSFYDVDGRVEDYVLTPDGRRVGRMDHVFKEQREVAEAQILQESAAEIEVLIVPLANYDERSERNVIREFRSRLGTEIGIRLRRVEEIPREPNGKFRAVKSTIGKIEEPAIGGSGRG